MSDPDKYSAEEYGLFADLANLSYEEKLNDEFQDDLDRAMERYANSQNVSTDYQSLHFDTDLDSKYMDWRYPFYGALWGGTGFTGHSFYSEKDNRLVIAFAGTDPTDLDDLVTDAQLWNFGATQQDLQAINFAVESMKMLSADGRAGSDLEIVITGHSLGGFLSQVVSQRLGESFDDSIAEWIDVIGDFDSAEDRIDLSELGVSFADLIITETNDETEIWIKGSDFQVRILGKGHGLNENHFLT